MRKPNKITPEMIHTVRELRKLGWHDASIVVTLKMMGWKPRKATRLIDASYDARRK